MGAAQIKAELKRFKGWRISIRAIDRVLRNADYEPVHRGSRRKEGPGRRVDDLEERLRALGPRPGGDLEGGDDTSRGRPERESAEGLPA